MGPYDGRKRVRFVMSGIAPQGLAGDDDEDYDPTMDDDGAHDQDDSDDDYGDEEAYQRPRSHKKKHGGNSTPSSYRIGGNYMYRVGVPPVIPDSQIAAEEGVHRSTIWRRRQKALKQSGRSGGGGYVDPRSMPGGSRAKGARRGASRGAAKASRAAAAAEDYDSEDWAEAREAEAAVAAMEARNAAVAAAERAKDARAAADEAAAFEVATHEQFAKLLHLDIVGRRFRCCRATAQT